MLKKKVLHHFVHKDLKKWLMSKDQLMSGQPVLKVNLSKVPVISQKKMEKRNLIFKNKEWQGLLCICHK